MFLKARFRPCSTLRLLSSCDLDTLDFLDLFRFPGAAGTALRSVLSLPFRFRLVAVRVGDLGLAGTADCFGLGDVLVEPPNESDIAMEQVFAGEALYSKRRKYIEVKYFPRLFWILELARLARLGD